MIISMVRLALYQSLNIIGRCLRLAALGLRGQAIPIGTQTIGGRSVFLLVVRRGRRQVYAVVDMGLDDHLRLLCLLVFKEHSHIFLIHRVYWEAPENWITSKNIPQIAPCAQVINPIFRAFLLAKLQ